MVEAWPVMRIAETVSQNSRPEWDALSACGPVGKLHPTPRVNSGSHFPLRLSTGKCIPFQALIPGHSFRTRRKAESVSQSERRFWDTLPETLPIWKACLTLNTSSGCRRACLPGRPRHRGDGKCRPTRLPRLLPRVSRKSLEDFEAFASVLFRTRGSDRPTRPARPSWRLPPCCPDLPWSDGPSRQPSCRAAS